MRFQALLRFGIALVGVAAAPALACPDGQYESCGPFNICVCVPEIGGDVGRTTEHLKNELRAQTVGLPLEQWIYASRSTSAGGAMPIPQAVRQALAGLTDADAMNRARFRIGDMASSTLPM